jgi:hypothetical protein
MPTGTRSRIYWANASRVTDVIRSSVMYFIDLQGGVARQPDGRPYR